jgi:hypothetical protein
MFGFAHEVTGAGSIYREVTHRTDGTETRDVPCDKTRRGERAVVLRDEDRKLRLGRTISTYCLAKT